jgi:hypothetical protein
MPATGPCVVSIVARGVGGAKDGQAGLFTMPPARCRTFRATGNTRGGSGLEARCRPRS